MRKQALLSDNQIPRELKIQALKNDDEWPFSASVQTLWPVSEPVTRRRTEAQQLQ